MTEATEGLLRPTHKPSTSSSSYQLITRQPSSSSLCDRAARPSKRLRRPYPLAALYLVDIALIIYSGRRSQILLGAGRCLVGGTFVGCSAAWRRKHGAVLFVSLGSLVSVLWEVCQAVMDGSRNWRSTALAATTGFVVLEYLTYILLLRLFPPGVQAMRYETAAVSTPSTPSPQPLSLEEGDSEEGDDDDVSSISSSEIVDLPPPRSPARLLIDVDPARLVRRRSRRFFGGEASDEDAASSGDEGEQEEDRLGRSLSRSWRLRTAPEDLGGYGTFRS